MTAVLPQRSAANLPAVASVARAAALRGHVAALGLILACGAIAPPAAWAQMNIPGAPVGTGNIANGKGAARGGEAPYVPGPAAIPGAQARQPAAPATRAAGDMQPTDALFDAINRGDIASARDALNRGADLNGVNILGMTPMELSVDLGRNDISFLLLSMRGEDSGRGSRAVGRDGGAANAKAAQAPKPAAPAKAAPAKAAAAKVANVVNPPAAPKPVAPPKLFANDGGAPLPAAGFLGFGSRSAAN